MVVGGHDLNEIVFTKHWLELVVWLHHSMGSVNDQVVHIICWLSDKHVRLSLLTFNVVKCREDEDVEIFSLLYYLYLEEFNMDELRLNQQNFVLLSFIIFNHEMVTALFQLNLGKRVLYRHFGCVWLVITFVFVVATIVVPCYHDSLGVDIDLDSVLIDLTFTELFDVEVVISAFTMVVHLLHSGHGFLGPLVHNFGTFSKIFEDLEYVLIDHGINGLLHFFNIHIKALFAVVIPHQDHEYLIHIRLCDIQHLIEWIFAEREDLIRIDVIEV